MPTGVDAVTVGGCTVDIVHTADGVTAGPQIGGSAIYAAVGARIWGVSCGIVALRGTGLPAGWEEALATLGVDTAGLVPVDEPALRSEFFYERDGSRTERVRRAGTRGPRLPYLPADTDEPIRALPLTPDYVPGTYRQARGVHIAPLRYEQQVAMAGAFADRAPVMLDPYASVMAAVTDEALGRLLRPLTAFLPSLEELKARFDPLEIEEAARSLQGLGAELVVVKRGRLGCVVYGHVQGYPIPAVPVTARDPTGAGDAFCGGFLAGWLTRRDPVHAAVCGSVAASFVAEDFWFRAALSLDEAERDRRYKWVRDRLS